MNVTRCMVLSILSILLVGTSPVLASTLTFTEQDSGTAVHVNPGDTIILTLVENPSTGFRWFMDASRGLILKSDEYEPAGSGLIGAAGVRTWTYTVTVNGMLSMSGIYKQGWMPTTGDEDVFTLTLISGERNFKNSRTTYWWDSVPKFTRLSRTPVTLQGLSQKFPGRFF